jgi:hypothetical protein
MLLTGITSVRDMAGDARALSNLSRDAWWAIVAPNIYYSSLMAGSKFLTPEPLQQLKEELAEKCPI